VTRKLFFIFIIYLSFLPVLYADDAILYRTHIKPIFTAKCLGCHSEHIQQGELRLDKKEFAFNGGVSGKVIIPGNAEKSLLVQLIKGNPPEKRMPLSGKPLSNDEIAEIEKWINTGAAWEDDGEEITPVTFDHWSFKAPVHHDPPEVENTEWVSNPIDNFILAKIEENGLQPSPEADRYTLIRRASLDLTGILPTPEEVDAFVYDDDPNAYEKLVDHLLASPHYGERWGRHWLDAARYADSNGYSIDAPREIWKYRDWVIDAFNKDLSFDRFTIYQIAGDMVPQPNNDSLIATGFHRNTKINQEGGIDVEQFRIESIVDRVNTTGTVFLGLTVGCCQCHDHKYDPITQKEYYQFFDFFNQDDEPDLVLATPKEQKKIDAINAQLKILQDELNQYGDELKKEFDAKKEAGEAEGSYRDYQRNDEGYSQRNETIRNLRRDMPEVPKTMILRSKEEPRESYIHIQGDFTRHGDVVTAGTPKVLPALYVEEKHPSRLDLAQWLVSQENPLTARVTMNRFWQRYFGVGIVQTENDFGTRGAPPTHPELLDWLATEFMRRGWSMKTMHRLIVTSSTYKQSSNMRPELYDIDPYNKLLARQNRNRIDAEIIRDAALVASGLFDDTIGGPSVYPPQPDGVTKLGQVNRPWKVSSGGDRYRRSMYTFFWRGTPHPALLVFDAPDSNTACTRRNRSNIPLQALNLLNDEAFFECAVQLAERILNEIPQGDIERIRRVFRLVLNRNPRRNEIEILHSLIKDNIKDFSGTPQEAASIAKWVDESKHGKETLAAWAMVCRVVLNLDEFITRE
jgi:hypothetical protein